MKKLTILLILCNLLPCALSRTIYVDANGTGDYPTIQSAIQAAHDSDKIILLPGTYKGIGNRDINFLGKAITVQSTDANDPNIVGRTIINCEGNDLEPHVALFFDHGETNSSILKGLTITNGYVSHTGPPGIITCRISDPVITACIIKNNTGKAISVYRGSPIISDNIITMNQIRDYSEGLVAFHEGQPIIVNNEISDNFTEYEFSPPYAIQAFGYGEITINNNLFINNGIVLGGYWNDARISENTFMYFDGFENAAIDVGGTSDNSLSVRIGDNIFKDFSGGDIFFGGPLCISIGGTGNMIGNGVIERNTFDNITGMAINLRGTSRARIEGFIRNNTFKDVTGTAIDLRGTGNVRIQGFVRNNTFTDVNGPAIYMGGTGDAIIQGTVSNNNFRNCGFLSAEIIEPTISLKGTGEVNVYAWIKNNLIVGKGTSSSGPGIYIGGISHSRFNGIFENNTILDNNQGIVKRSNVYEFAVRNSIIFDNYEDLSGIAIGEISYCDVNNPIYSGINGNICVSPEFVDPANRDYQLKPESLCINAGDPNYTPEPNETDLEGNSRIIDGRIDMGCYEFQFNTAPVSVAGPNQVVYICSDDEVAYVTLDGSASYDDDNDVLDYYWSWYIDSNLYEVNGVSPTIQLPAGEYEIELIVDDGTELSESNYCIVTVIEPLETELRCVPKKLNTNSRGMINAIIFLPEEILPQDIDINEPVMFLPGGVESVNQFIEITDQQVTSVHAQFEKENCLDYLSEGMNDITVVGKLNSGRCYRGKCTINIFMPKPFRL